MTFTFDKEDFEIVKIEVKELRLGDVLFLLHSPEQGWMSAQVVSIKHKFNHVESVLQFENDETVTLNYLKYLNAISRWMTVYRRKGESVPL